MGSARGTPPARGQTLHVREIVAGEGSTVRSSTLKIPQKRPLEPLPVSSASTSSSPKPFVFKGFPSPQHGRGCVVDRLRVHGVWVREGLTVGVALPTRRRNLHRAATAHEQVEDHSMLHHKR